MSKSLKYGSHDFPAGFGFSGSASDAKRTPVRAHTRTRAVKPQKLAGGGAVVSRPGAVRPELAGFYPEQSYVTFPEDVLTALKPPAGTPAAAPAAPGTGPVGAVGSGSQQGHGGAYPAGTTLSDVLATSNPGSLRSTPGRAVPAAGPGAAARAPAAASPLARAPAASPLARAQAINAAAVPPAPAVTPLPTLRPAAARTYGRTTSKARGGLVEREPVQPTEELKAAGGRGPLSSGYARGGAVVDRSDPPTDELRAAGGTSPLLSGYADGGAVADPSEDLTQRLQTLVSSQGFDLAPVASKPASAPPPAVPTTSPPSPGAGTSGGGSPYGAAPSGSYGTSKKSYGEFQRGLDQRRRGSAPLTLDAVGAALSNAANLVSGAGPVMTALGTLGERVIGPKLGLDLGQGTLGGLMDIPGHVPPTALGDEVYARTGDLAASLAADREARAAGGEGGARSRGERSGGYSRGHASSPAGRGAAVHSGGGAYAARGGRVVPPKDGCLVKGGRKR